MQGDPLSLYIFIICAEYLGHHILFMSTQTRSGISIKLTKDSPNIHFLMFADDCIYFAMRLKEPQKLSHTLIIIEEY